jgi:ABC-type nitrate/sulfonate/bicarbonate transport system substrate-binding protein
MPVLIRLIAIFLILFIPRAVVAADAELAPKIALNFTWQAAYMPLLYGQAKGYFKAANVAPDFIPTRGSDQALQFIESGQVDYAFVDSDTFLASAAQKKTTTTAVYVWLDKPTLDVVSTAPLDGPGALRGKSFGTLPQSTARTVLPFVLLQNKVDPKSVDIQALDFSVLYPLFLRGGVDTAEIHAPGSWQNLQAQASAQGKKLYLTRMKDWGLVGYDKILIVRNSVLRDSPGDVKRVVGAINRSLIEALAHATDTEAYDLLKAVVPQAKEGPLVADWHDYKDLVQKPGAIDARVFDNSLHRLKAVGIITDIPTVSTLYANQVR